MNRKGTLYVVPNTLDLGTQPPPPIDWTLPAGVLTRAARLTHWIAENAKTTRSFLKRVDAVVPLCQALQEVQIAELPRPPKGRTTLAAPSVRPLLKPALEGLDMGLISEAGLPGVADPGASVVAAAHQAGLEVVSLAGPSAIVLALAASGLQGQSFAFVGYLPVEAQARALRIRELEGMSRRLEQTQLMIETPYRNAALFGALLEHLSPATRLSISCGLTLPGGFSRTESVATWRQTPQTLPQNMPAVFAFQA